MRSNNFWQLCTNENVQRQHWNFWSRVLVRSGPGKNIVKVFSNLWMSVTSHLYMKHVFFAISEASLVCLLVTTHRRWRCRDQMACQPCLNCVKIQNSVFKWHNCVLNSHISHAYIQVWRFEFQGTPSESWTYAVVKCLQLLKYIMIC